MLGLHGAKGARHSPRRRGFPAHAASPYLGAGVASAARGGSTLLSPEFRLPLKEDRAQAGAWALGSVPAPRGS